MNEYNYTNPSDPWNVNPLNLRQQTSSYNYNKFKGTFLYELKEKGEYIIKDGEKILKLIIYEKYENCSLIGIQTANDIKDIKSYILNDQKFIIVDEVTNKHKRQRKLNNLLKDDE